MNLRLAAFGKAAARENFGPDVILPKARSLADSCRRHTSRSAAVICVAKFEGFGVQLRHVTATKSLPSVLDKFVQKHRVMSDTESKIRQQIPARNFRRRTPIGLQLGNRVK